MRFDVLGVRDSLWSRKTGDKGRSGPHFATIRRPWTMPLAPLATVTTDYLANDYFAVSPFSLEGDPNGSRVYFRIHPQLTGALAEQPLVCKRS
jgi:hypothetical protein